MKDETDILSSQRLRTGPEQTPLTPSIVDASPSVNPMSQLPSTSNEQYEIEYEFASNAATRKASIYMVAAMPIFFIAITLLGIFTSPHPEVALQRLMHLRTIYLLLPVFLGSGFFAWLLSRRGKICRASFSPDGITFSDVWKMELLGRLHRPWSDLHSIQLTFPELTPEIIWKDDIKRGSWYQSLQYHMGPRLIFDFKSGGSAYFSLKYLKREEAEVVIRAIESWANPATLSADVVKLEKGLLLEQNLSFTSMWSEDLNTNYIATNYVPLRTNQILQSGKYTVKMQLAAGGMSAVYLAATDDGAKVVLKEAVAPRNADDQIKAKAKELFLREAKLLLRLRHPQIARVLDSFSENERDYLVLEYVPGATMRQLVKQGGAVNESKALDWAGQLASIVEFLHSQSPPVLHRDLSPDNIIIKENGQIILVDFGAANEFVGNATGTFVGKQCYMAPEQLRGHAIPQSDLYSLGGTIYFALTGSDPMPLMPSSPKEKAPQTSERCNLLVQECTDFEPEARPVSARILSEKIKAISARPKNLQRS